VLYESPAAGRPAVAEPPTLTRMARAEAAPSLLSTLTAPDLAAADELYRSYRAAASRGEDANLSLTFREGKAGASLTLGTSAGSSAAAARPRASAQPSRSQRAAAGPAPTCSPPAPARPSPPDGRKVGPRSRGPGALLRDERRRLLRIAVDVFGTGGRCPPPTVHRPTILAAGQVGRRVEEQEGTPASSTPPLAALPASNPPSGPPSRKRLRPWSGSDSSGIGQVDGADDLDLNDSFELTDPVDSTSGYLWPMVALPPYLWPMATLPGRAARPAPRPLAVHPLMTHCAATQALLRGRLVSRSLLLHSLTPQSPSATTVRARAKRRRRAERRLLLPPASSPPFMPRPPPTAGLNLLTFGHYPRTYPRGSASATTPVCPATDTTNDTTDTTANPLPHAQYLLPRKC
jgi:hypothetical protein